MGGIHTDLEGATSLGGLYAAGETACVSINGANRLGSNSLTELLVFGARAGDAAARLAGEGGEAPSSVAKQAVDEERRLRESLLEKAGGSERVADLRDRLQSTMEEGAGIYRDEAGLAAAIGAVDELRDRFSDLALEDRSLTFNTQLVAALELSNLLDVAQAILHSARARTESRGAHQRTDFPDRDDERFLAHTMAYRGDDGRPRTEWLPVTITRWPPAERVYGR